MAEGAGCAPRLDPSGPVVNHSDPILIAGHPPHTPRPETPGDEPYLLPSPEPSSPPAPNPHAHPRPGSSGTRVESRRE